MTVLALQAAVAAAASCGFEPLWRSIDRGNVTAVFSGTVVGIQFVAAGNILTFEVDTIWKGNLSRTMLIYHPTGQPPASNAATPAVVHPPQSGFPTGRGSGSGVGPGIEGFRPFEVTRRYVVTAHLLSDEDRALFKVDGKGAYLSVSPCGGMLYDEAQATGDLDRAGRGRPPQ